MNNLMIFEGHEVEVIEISGKVLFNANHVAEVLEIKNVRDNLKNMNENQVVRLTNSAVGLADTRNSDVHNLHIRKLNNAGENFLTESGVYKLVFKSRKPNAEKFTDWIADEVLPTIRKTGSYSASKKHSPDERIRIMEMNARTRMAQTYLKLAQVDTLSSTYKSVLVAKGAEVLSGEKIVPLPEIEQKQAYSAKEIGDMFGVSSNKVGRIANKHGLKIDKYGEYRRSKSEHSPKEVDTWVYFDTVIPVLEGILGMEVA